MRRIVQLVCGKYRSFGTRRLAWSHRNSHLIRYLGGEHVAGGQLKEAGYINWYSPNTGATNRSGFTGQGSGGRLAEAGNFIGHLETGFYWTRTPAGSEEYAVYFSLIERSAAIEKSRNIIHFEECGFSVRCIKN